MSKLAWIMVLALLGFVLTNPIASGLLMEVVKATLIIPINMMQTFG